MAPSPPSAESRLATRVRSGLVSIVAGESERAQPGDGFGIMLMIDLTRSTRGSAFSRSWSASKPACTSGSQIPPTVGEWTTTISGVGSPGPKSSRSVCTAWRDTASDGSTSTVVPVVLIQTAGKASSKSTSNASAPVAKGRRMTAAMVRCQPCPWGRFSHGIRARRFQRSRWRCRNTNTVGSRKRAVTTATAATIAIATATERMIITGKRLSTAIVSAKRDSRNVTDRPAVCSVRSSACSSGAERNSSRKRLTMISEKSIARPRPIIVPMLSAKIETSVT